ncbi:ORF21 protein [Operophtera brumata nucleopolyhedrovirus]|uniref:ORF21 protein n=1 Tax=Operophtera brumata nucleopolyhedrovirus TaxID=1046267 RepID=A0A2H4UZM7_9ABAC|nr:ORF21 protein [Operophtera brumata nucleopolyhedrovirus]AUA60252.1 ORF21 protein [Operophtera brumata nucleopolyhedrovirus]
MFSSNKSVPNLRDQLCELERLKHKGRAVIAYLERSKYYTKDTKELQRLEYEIRRTREELLKGIHARL